MSSISAPREERRTPKEVTFFEHHPFYEVGDYYSEWEDWDAKDTEGLLLCGLEQRIGHGTIEAALQISDGGTCAIEVERITVCSISDTKRVVRLPRASRVRVRVGVCAASLPLVATAKLSAYSRR